MGAALVDLVGTRRPRPVCLRRRQRGPRQHRGAGRPDVAQHRLGCLGQCRRGPDGGDAHRNPSGGGSRGLPPRIAAPRSDLGSLSRLATSKPVSNPGSAGRRSSSPSLPSTGIPAPTSPRRTSSRHPRLSAPLPRSGPPSSGSTRSVSTIVSSTWVGTHSSRCRSRRRSATASRSRCRCSSCSPPRPSGSWRSSSSGAS